MFKARSIIIISGFGLILLINLAIFREAYIDFLAWFLNVSLFKHLNRDGSAWKFVAIFMNITF